MDSDFLLIQQKPLPRKSSPVSRFLPLVLLLSLSCNVYFVWDRMGMGGAPIVAAEAAEAEVIAPVANVEIPGMVAESAHSVEATPSVVPVKADAFDKYQAQQASYFAPEKMPGRELRTLQFKIEHSLNRTMCDLLPDPECKLLSAYMSRLLMWHLDISSHLRRGDTVSLVYERLEAEQDLRILHLSYDSAYLGKRLVANYYQPTGARYGSYFDEQGQEVALRLKDESAPIRDYSEITSLPGDFRAGTWSGHSGTDFKADNGTPVHAPFEGRVTRVNWNRRANGMCVELDHPREGAKTLFLHLNHVLVRPGQYVKAGEKIAESGNTGRSFAPHLHYEMRARNNKNKIINPFRFEHHSTYHRSVSDLPRYREAVQRYASILQSSLS